MGYSRKENPTLQDLSLIWDDANSDWRLATLSNVFKLFVAGGPGTKAEVIDGSLDNITTTGIYGIGPLTTEQPVGVLPGSLVDHKSFDLFTAMQVVYDTQSASPAMYIRSKALGVWGVWVNVLTEVDGGDAATVF